MSAVEHELRVKIDASPAESGAKRFTAAIASIRKAVEGLEKDSEGAFLALKNFKPQFDVTPITKATTASRDLATALTGASTASTKVGTQTQQAALAASMALRQASTSAQKLAFRLGDLGQTASLDALDAGLDRLHAQLRRAPDVASVRVARSVYEDLRVELTQTATAAEYAKGDLAQLAREQAEAARGAAQHASQLSALRAEFNPLFAASKQYEATLARIETAEKQGAISAQLAANARATAAATLQGFDRVGRAASNVGYQVQNASYQVGDFFVQVAAGTDATRALAMQLPQLLGGFGVFGAVAGAVAAIMGALIPLLFSGGENARTFDDALSDLNSTLTTYRDSTEAVNGGTLALREEFGLAAESAQRFHAAIAAVAAIKMEQQLQDGVASLAATMAGVTDLMSQWDGATFLPEALRPEAIYLTADAVARLQSEFGLTLNQAHALTDAISAAKMAKGPEATSAAMGKVVTLLLAARDAGAKLPPELVKAVEEAATLGLTADRLSAILAPMPSTIGAATGQTNAWAGAMSGVRMEINAILSSLSAIGGGVISNAAKRAEVTALQAGQTVRQAEVARLRFENEQKMTAKEMGAGSGVSGWAQRQLIQMERFQFDEGIRLDDQLNAQREAARKRETSSAGGGGGGGRTAALSEEKTATDELTKSLTERLTSLDEERTVLGLVASGMFKTTEAAELFAKAQIQGGGAVDAQTAAMIAQIDAAARLNEELTKAAKDPVKEWMDSVPNWLEAGKQIEMGAIDSLKGAISEMIKTGKFDIESLGEAILGTIADIVADKAVKELMTMFGRGEQSATGGFAGMLAGLFSSEGDTDLASMMQGGTQAGATIATSMTQAGAQVAAQIQAAMTGAGAQAGMSVQSGLASGSVNVRSAAQTGLAVGANNIRLAATSSGPVLGQGVIAGAQQGAPILAQGVAMGAAGGGGGGGLLAGVGGWGGLLSMALGAFSEGGYSTSPVGVASAPVSAFRNAPHFAQGTANTSGIPAVLHPNEAVIPLSKGRKIPVELGDSAGGGNTVVQNMSFSFPNADVESFRRSRKQVAADMASAGQVAVRQNR